MSPRLFTSGDYSDLTITCGSDIYNVHKNIVCSESEFFERAERFPGKVGSTSAFRLCARHSAYSLQEGTTNSIHLPKDDPALIKLLMQYLYEAEYKPNVTDKQTVAPGSSSPMVPKVCYEHCHYDFPHTCSNGCPLPKHMVCQRHSCSS